MSYKILILTDPSRHSATNSLYGLAKTLRQHPKVAAVHVASRALAQNAPFFYQMSSQQLQLAEVKADFAFQEDQSCFAPSFSGQLSDYDFIFLRLPRPLADGFLEWLGQIFPEERIINRPSGILQTSSKAFLLEIAEHCPPMARIRSLAELEAFKARFPIVLKPLLNYGGQGVLRILDDYVWEGNNKQPYTEWASQQKELDYLGMQYLERVAEGDKRIVVCNGQVITAAIRFPAKDSWMCNVAQGGHAEASQVSPEEEAMVAALHPILQEKGILLYGLDTLMGTDGKRLLSELNTLSIGGIAPAGEAALQASIEGLIHYFDSI
ncbi:glutathione synthetase [Saprospira sp. CCB-QB6]|uniref:ATP-grasp domain-containing protein n=1 Tax=Saprospira sp. CCB-QB6 TaxID=3023936 RepID=UPI00234B5910|nr:glutathione synthetase [Saprospira sp. CCB-QB6]WCL81756.1 glutathione synthetase [Saprospira sp. CCB-QB6]